jgi:hypothetical protein
MGVSYYKSRIWKDPQKKRFLMGNFLIQGQWENQEQDERTSSGGTHHRSWLFEDGGDEQKTGKKWGVFWGRPGPRRGCSAIDGCLGVGMVVTGRRDYMGIMGTSRSYEVSVCLSVGVYFAYRSHIAEPPTVIKELHLKEKRLLCSMWLEGSYLWKISL